MRPFAPLALLLIVSCFTNEWVSGAESANLDAVPRVLESFVSQKQLVGAVTAVGTRDGCLRIDAVGKLRADADQVMPKDALFRIASMTKPITATAIMMLVDDGKLSVSDPVEKHLPEFRGQWLVESREPAKLVLKKPARPITIRDLLTHTSGLPGGYPEGASDLYVRRHLSLAEGVLLNSQRPLEFEPGGKWAYCNAGIDTLGRIVEAASGMSFENFLSERLFRPLGMVDTTFYPSEDQQSRIPPVYDRKDGELVPAASLILGLPSNPRHPVPAGGLYSTAADLARFYRLTLNGGAADGKQLVSASSLAEMTKLQTGDLTCGFVPGMGFGYGFAVVREPQGVTAMLSTGTYGHGGAFGTQGWVDPQRGVFVILLIQRVGMPNADGSDIRREFQSVVFPTK